jgi:arylformamidase
MKMTSTIVGLSVILACLTLSAQAWPRPGASVSPAPRPTTPAPLADALTRTLDIRYANTPGVDAKSQSLDIYAPKDAKNAPVIVFIHGGGWRNGDKSNPGVGSQPAAHFCAQGFVFVSINYRLTPAGRHPANIQDVAKAVAWVHDHIAEYGGDPAQINIMGHSAGAHLAALVATDETRLRAEGKPLSIVKRAILLDTAAYDIPRYLTGFRETRGASPMRQLYTNAFGDTEEQWRDASPQAHVAPGKHIPPMLMFFTGSRMAANALAPAFAEALTKAGAPSRAVDTITLTHNEIGMKAADDNHPLGQLVLRFLRGENATTFPARLELTHVVTPEIGNRPAALALTSSPEQSIED